MAFESSALSWNTVDVRGVDGLLHNGRVFDVLAVGLVVHFGGTRHKLIPISHVYHRRNSHHRNGLGQCTNEKLHTLAKKCPVEGLLPSQSAEPWKWYPGLLLEPCGVVSVSRPDCELKGFVLVQLFTEELLDELLEERFLKQLIVVAKLAGAPSDDQLVALVKVHYQQQHYWMMAAHVHFAHQGLFKELFEEDEDNCDGFEGEKFVWPQYDGITTRCYQRQPLLGPPEPSSGVVRGFGGGLAAALLGHSTGEMTQTGAVPAPPKQVTMGKITMGVPHLGYALRGSLMRMFVVFLALNGVCSMVSAELSVEVMEYTGVPQLSCDSISMSPMARLSVSTAKEDTSQMYLCLVIEGEEFVSCDADWLLESGSRTGRALVKFVLVDNGRATFCLREVYVAEVFHVGIDVFSGADGSRPMPDGTGGLIMRLPLSYYDLQGGRLDVVSGSIYRRTRFVTSRKHDDIVTITRTREGNNVILVVRCTKPGRTILTAWLADKGHFKEKFVEIRVATVTAALPPIVGNKPLLSHTGEESDDSGNLRLDSVKTSRDNFKVHVFDMARGTLGDIPKLKSPSRREEEEDTSERESRTGPEAEEQDKSWASSQPQVDVRGPGGAPIEQVPDTFSPDKSYLVVVLLFIALLTVFLLKR